MLKKLCIGCKKKQHYFVVYIVTHRMRFLFIYKKKWEKKAENCLFEFWRTLVRAVTYLSSDGAELSVRLFGQNKPFFFFYVFCGECG